MIAADRRDARPVPLSRASWLFVLFVVVQALDGVLTYIGVRLLGVGVEANALLASTIHAVGAVQALFLAKLLACCGGYILHRTGAYRPLAVMSGLYLAVAVIPWLGILRGVLVSLVLHGPIKP